MINPNLLKYSNLIKTKRKLKIKKFNLNIEFLIYIKKYKKIIYLKIEKMQIIKKKNREVKIFNFKKKTKKQIINFFSKKIEKKNKYYLSNIPNLPDNSTLNNKNKIIKLWGKPIIKKYKLINHIKIGQKLKGLDFKSSVKLSCSRFVIMKGKIAQMHRALIQFMMDLHIEKHGYLEIYVPYLVNKNTLFCTGQLPNFYKNLLHVKFYNKLNKNKEFALIPTGEVPLTNIFCNKILQKKNLPLKLITHTPCFRSENKSYGKFNQGLIRMIQFEKIEIIQITTKETSMNILEEITNHAEKILQLLKLPYRKILLCAKNLGFSSSKTYDLEVWLPSQKKYCEISSCSNMTDFQSRRMNTKYLNKNKKKLVHTLNASGLALSRTLAAVIENYQTKDGKIEIPRILYPYMKNIKYIY